MGENWLAIQAVADELLKHEELDFDEVELIVEYDDTRKPEIVAALAQYRRFREAAGGR